jgi:hypothetical protein
MAVPSPLAACFAFGQGARALAGAGAGWRAARQGTRVCRQSACTCGSGVAVTGYGARSNAGCGQHHPHCARFAPQGTVREAKPAQTAVHTHHGQKAQGAWKRATGRVLLDLQQAQAAPPAHAPRMARWHPRCLLCLVCGPAAGVGWGVVGGLRILRKRPAARGRHPIGGVPEHPHLRPLRQPAV